MKIKPISNTLTMTNRIGTSRTPKSMNLPQRFTLLAGFFAVAMLSGCAGGTNLNVINGSTAELTNVVATGSRFTKSIGSIPAGGQRNISINLPGESALKLDFDTNGKHRSSDPQGYFEGGSNTKVTAVVAPDLTVTVNTN
jgi:hypothetical protein